MNIKITHPFMLCAHDIDELFRGVCKISTFCSRLEAQATWHPSNYPPNDYLGDGFEMLVEGLIKLSPADNRIGITQYRPVPKSEDSGVDGVGIGIDGKPAAVQIKYKSDKTRLLSNQEDKLTNLTTTAWSDLGVDVASVNSLFIFTTGAGLLPSTEKFALKNKVKCVGYPQLRELLDNNHGFWESMRELTSSTN